MIQKQLSIHTVTQSFDCRRLKLAREMRRCKKKDLAIAAEVSPAAISQFELGSNAPKSTTLAKIAFALRIPIEFFMHRANIGFYLYNRQLRDSPVLPLEECYFRSLAKVTKAERKQVLAKGCLGLTLYDIMQDLYGAQFPKNDIQELQKKGSMLSDGDIEAFALEVRKRWIADELGEKYMYSPIGYQIIRLLESKGIRVLMMRDHSPSLDAFSVDQGVPCIFVSLEKEIGSRIPFNVAHELGHLLLHQDVEAGTENRLLEEQANRFAAEFLMPRRMIKTLLPHRINQNAWSSLFELKLKMGVSVSALLYRAFVLGRISKAVHSSARRQMNIYGWRVQEPYEELFMKKLVLPSVLKDIAAVLHSKYGLGVLDYARALSISEMELQSLFHFKFPHSKENERRETTMTLPSPIRG